MSPEVGFDDIDIVINRNTLRKLLDWCDGRSVPSFRLNLFLVNNTLIVERCDKNVRAMAGLRAGQNAGYGRNFEKHFTKVPPGAGDCSGYHRVLRYSLGDLRCAVHFEVDACCVDNVAIAGGTISTKPQSSKTTKAEERIEVPVMATRKLRIVHNPTLEGIDQSVAAEMKTQSSPKGSGSYLAQLWFGRTPWLVVGQHLDGKFHTVNISNVASRFADWEAKNQVDLRKMVAVLGQLREAVKRHQGGNCIAIYERTTQSRVIKIFTPCLDRLPLPKEMISRSWSTGV